jgi:hypothetical protein
MATQSVCVFNKYGFCKYLETCRNYHEKKICEISQCEVRKCPLRHPKICKFYRDNGYCKFGEFCYFSHKTKMNIENYRKENEEILSKLAEVDRSLKALEEKERETKAIIENLKAVNEQSESQNKMYENLMKRFNEMEVKLAERDIQIDNLLEKVQNFEQSQTNLNEESGSYNCNKCDFKTYHKKGLKIHRRKKHGSTTCELCDNIFDSVRELKIHTYTHSFTNINNSKQTCKNCKLETKTVESMEIHLGKCRIENFECGLCDKKFQDLDKLDLHLFTCEIYECGECYIRDTNLSNIKKHIQDTHENSTKMLYLKMDRNESGEVSSKFYSLSEV